MTTTITATDTETGHSETVVIRDNYCLITDGTCQLTTTQITYGKHVLTVTGVDGMSKP